MFTAENAAQAVRTFAHLMAELVALFVGISFVVALLQVYVSPGKIQRLLSRPGREHSRSAFAFVDFPAAYGRGVLAVRVHGGDCRGIYNQHHFVGGRYV